MTEKKEKYSSGLRVVVMRKVVASGSNFQIQLNDEMMRAAELKGGDYVWVICSKVKIIINKVSDADLKEGG